MYLEPFVLYETGIDSLRLILNSGSQLQFPDTLANGRANYILFEELVRTLTGLQKTAGSDHEGSGGLRYEQKAFSDRELHPSASKNLFQTSASSTFGANNQGPKIDKLLASGDYAAALEICEETGYSKNDFYIYTNTRGYNPSVPFRHIVVPTSFVLSNLDLGDPRLISRDILLENVIRTEVIG